MTVWSHTYVYSHLGSWVLGFECPWEHGFSSQVFVVCCAGSAICDGLITVAGESYRVCACVCVILWDLITSTMRRSRPNVSCWTTKKGLKGFYNANCHSKIEFNDVWLYFNLSLKYHLISDASLRRCFVDPGLLCCNTWKICAGWKKWQNCWWEISENWRNQLVTISKHYL